jgi:hypothetical protein
MAQTTTRKEALVFQTEKKHISSYSYRSVLDTVVDPFMFGIEL